METAAPYMYERACASGPPREGPAMITVVQRVQRAVVTVDGAAVGAIGPGLLLLVAVERHDSAAEADETARKIAKLRCFPGRTPMDLSVAERGGACLVVSQFTLCGELARGNRPSFTAAALPGPAAALVSRVCEQLRALGLPVETGSFGARMAVELVNDGPVTFTVTVRGGRVLPRDGRELPAEQ